jgi:hypothetical protein
VYTNYSIQSARAIYVSHTTKPLVPHAKIRFGAANAGILRKGPLGAPLAEMREAVVPKLRHQPDLFTLAATRGYTRIHKTHPLPPAHTQNERVYVCAQHTYPRGSLNFGDE